MFTYLLGDSELKSCVRVQELCESRSGRPGLSVLMSLTVSVDVKQHRTMFIGTGHSLYLICQLTSEDTKLYILILIRSCVKVDVAVLDAKRYRTEVLPLTNLTPYR